MFWLFEITIINLHVMYKLYKITINKSLTYVDYKQNSVACVCDKLAIEEVRRQLMHPTRLEKCHWKKQVSPMGNSTSKFIMFYPMSSQNIHEIMKSRMKQTMVCHLFQNIDSKYANILK